MLEKEVSLRCRKEDEQLIEKLLPECLDELKKVWGDTTKVTIDKQHYLPSENAGGVELTAKAGKIQVVSTLESRLDLIAGQVILHLRSLMFICFQIVPQVRTALFGPNPNRKFFD
jgi:V-type H+-transporting ATPase subunit E